MRLSALALLFILARGRSGAQGSFEAETEAAFRGKPCPRVTLSTPSGVRIELPPKPSSGPTVVTFLTSSCVPCRVEAPVLNRYFRQYSERGLRVIGIDTGDSAEVVKALIDKLNVSYPIAFDSGSAAQLFRAYAYPTTILIRADGQIDLYKIGSYSEIIEYLDSYFAKR